MEINCLLTANADLGWEMGSGAGGGRRSRNTVQVNYQKS